jgi:hypothetical protein
MPKIAMSRQISEFQGKERKLKNIQRKPQITCNSIDNELLNGTTNVRRCFQRIESMFSLEYYK